MSTKDHHSYMENSQCQIQHIVFDISVDFEAQRLRAKAQYKLNQASKGTLFLDTYQLEIHSVFSEKREIEWVLDKEDPILGQRLQLKNMDGISEFSIEYSTSPRASALQWTNPAQTAGKQHPFLYSQCQAIHARSLFPCQDSPSIRFTYQANIEVPKPLVAVMAATALGSKVDGEKNTYSFAMNQPIPSYLFALAAGNLKFVELGPRTGVYAEPETIEAAAWEYADNEKMLSETEKLLGPYLWERYDLLIMPPSFPFGGMENPRLTFLSSTAIVGDRSYLSIIYHELAHAWTGNLVTNASWEHFWINEGWTTYAEYRITEMLEGKESAQMLLASYLTSLRLIIERYGENHEFTRLHFDMQGIDPDEAWTTIPYYKGALFIKSLEDAVGRKNFDSFIQKYIKAFQFQSINTQEFLAFLEKELPDSLKKVDAQNWIYGLAEADEGFKAPSEAYAKTVRVFEAFLKNEIPEEIDFSEWDRNRRMVFLENLLALGSTSIENCQSVDVLFQLKESQDAGVLARFYDLCIKSGYAEILPRVEEYLTDVGRGLYINPLYRGLSQQSWGREAARKIFDRVKDTYHPVSAKNLEVILGAADL
jgi:aminopeptidase N